MGIYKKLLNIQKAVISLKKDTVGNNFAYLSGDKLLDVIRPAMDKEGILLKVEIISLKDKLLRYTTLKGAEKEEMYVELDILFTFIDVDTGETDVTIWKSTGMNGYDKSVGSALTYGERYFLMKFFHIATDEDDTDKKYFNEIKDPKIIALDDSVILEKLNSASTNLELATLYKELTTEQQENHKTLFGKRKTEIANTFTKMTSI